MIIVRNCFTAKPGQAGKLAQQLKAGAAVGGLRNFRVMTDLAGDFNTVVLEHEVENAAEFEDRMRDYGTNESFREKMKGYTDLWLTGRRELLKVV